MMKFLNLLIFIIFWIILASFSLNGKPKEKLHSDYTMNYQELKGPYLGQSPPGMKPEIFAPGIVSTSVSEGCISFSSDHTLFLFARAGVGILLMRQVNGKWTESKLAPFSAGKSDWDFMLAPDDKTVFISSGRSDKQGGETLRDYRIWKSQMNGDDWSNPILLPEPVNTGHHDSYPCVTNDKTLYFFSNRKGGLGEGDIYYAKVDGHSYNEVVNIGPPVNTTYHEVDAYVHPNEEYMIFCSDKPGGYGDSDLYISYKTEKESWSEPVNMGEMINSQAGEYIPYISPDGKYFFFTSNITGNREIYWVDAEIINELKPEL